MSITYVELRASTADLVEKFAAADSAVQTLKRTVEEASASMVRSAEVTGAALEGEAEKSVATATAMSESSIRSAGALEKVGIASESAAAQNKLAAEKMSADTSALTAKMELAAIKAEESNMRIGRSFEEAAAKSEVANKKSAGALGLATVAMGAVAVGSVDMAAKFESSNTRLVTSAGESAANIKLVGDGMLSMAGEVGVSAQKLSEGMYTVESAGYHGADGLKVLKAAAQGAKQENASLKTVADAVSTALTDYHLPAEQAANVTSQLVAAVGQGKTTMEEFSGALHSVTPFAAAAHVSLADVTGTLAEMTAHGVSAEQGAQNLAMAMRKMTSPTQGMRQEMAQLGITSSELSDKLGSRGISGTLQDLSTAILTKMGPGGKVLLDAFNNSKVAAQNASEAISKMSPPMADLAKKFESGQVTMKEWRAGLKGMPEDQARLGLSFQGIHDQAEGFTNALKNGSPQAQSYTQAMARLTGSSETLNTALMVSGENAAGTADNIAKISGATAEANGSVHGWGETQATFNQKLSETKASLGSMAISMGSVLLPVLKPIIDAFAAAAGWLAKHPALAQALIIVIVALTVAFAAMAIAMWAASATPITLIIGAIVVAAGVLVAAILWLVDNWTTVWGAIKAVIDTAWHWIQTNVIYPMLEAWHVISDALDAMGRFFSRIWDWIVSVVRGAWDWIYSNVVSPMKAAWKELGDALDWLGKLWDSIWKGIVGTVKWASDAIGSFIRGIKDMLATLTGQGQSAGSAVQGLIANIPRHADGGWTAGSPGEPSLAVVHGGEYVLSADMLAGRVAPDESVAKSMGDIGSPASSTAPRALSLAGGSGINGGGGITINVGSIIAERDLYTLMQTLTLKYGGRNASNGLVGAVI